jgi:ligand-binding sensor domain-containing protein
MKYVKLFALFLMVVFCSLCNAQNKTELLTSIARSEIKEVTTYHGPTTSVRTIKQDRKGNIWLASNEGIIQYDGKSFINIMGNLSSNRFFSVLEDKKGNFWFGNYGSGVYYYDEKFFQHFTTKQGLANNQVSTIYEDKDGNIWFGANGGVSRYDGKSFRNFTTEGGFSSNHVHSIIEDKTGKLWFGTGGYVSIYDGKTFTIVTDKDGNAFSSIWSIIEDKKGNIWLGGNDGLWRYDGSIYTKFTGNSVGYIYEDKKGNIWTSGNANGIWALSRYDEQSSPDKKPTVIEIKESLNLFGILETNDGKIWFGLFDGVYRYDGNTITDFKNKEVRK